MFRRLFGRKRASDINPAEGTPEPDARELHGHAAGGLTRAQLEFLSRLPPIDDHAMRVWDPNVGSVESCVKSLQKLGFIREASPAEKLDRTHSVAQLKKLATQYGSRKSGNKALIIDSLLAVIPDRSLRALVEGVRLYAPTETGEAIVADFKQAKALERSDMEAEAANALRAGRIEQAANVVAAYEAKQVFGRGMGINWSKGMSDTTQEQAALLLNSSYDDLPLDPSKQEEVAVGLALSDLLGQGSREAARRLMHLTEGKFACPELEAYLRDKGHGGYASGAKPDNPRDVAEVYAHTRLFAASSQITLARLKRHRTGKGVEILPVNDDCKICSGGPYRYAWSGLTDLPSLPLHWGCRCTYVPWVELD